MTTTIPISSSTRSSRSSTTARPNRAVELPDDALLARPTRRLTDPLVFACDWAQVDCSNITSKLVILSTPVTKANAYRQIGFTAAAGSIAPGQTSGEIETRIRPRQLLGVRDVSRRTRSSPTRASCTRTPKR